MRDSISRRFSALLLCAILLHGAAAKALGLETCPAHAAARHATGEAGTGAHEHAQHSDDSTPCRCAEACHMCCQAAPAVQSSGIEFSVAPGFTRIEPRETPGQIPGTRAYYLPFATAPPLQSI